MRRIWTMLAAAAVVAGYLAVVSPAQAATPKQLLARYQPVTLMDPLEPFRPTDVNGFVRDSVLETQSSPGVWTLVDGNPTLGTLPTRSSDSCANQGLVDCYRLNQQSCSPAGGPVGNVACYEAAWTASDPRGVVYGHVAYKPRRIVVQYWYFYYDDVYSYDYPPDDLFWQAHEGDWEAVTVVLRRSNQQPIYAAYSQHCTGVRRPWGQVERRGTHPVDHVAIGSHANLFEAGTQPIATQCIPAQAIAILQAQGLPMPVDRSNAGGAQLGPALDGVTPTQIRKVDRWQTPWVAFPGTWGEYQLFHAPAPIGTMVSGTAPPSPALQALWKTPLAVTSHWPEG
ncbi:MAG TPA: hypothetical protein VHL51_15225 [Gaiellales bacterium]|nr:hypothetical protein [Gaiellales bacterium]